MKKLVYVQISNEQYEDQIEIPGQTQTYFFKEQPLADVIDRALEKIRGVDDGEYYTKEDEILFDVCYTTDQMLGGQITINGDVQWDMEIHLCEFED